jgi:arylsulfatase A-like enzyme
MKQSRMYFRLLAVLFTVGLLSVAAAERPNVVVILTDDQGWGDLSVNGNRNLSTPNIDSLARDGAMFDRFFVCPVCSPTRAEFLTGRYHPRGGVYSTSAGGERLDLDEMTIGQTFQKGGYATGAFGKWHNGMQYPYHPNGRGFEEFYGFCSGHWGDYFSPPLDHNGLIVQGKGFCIDDFTDKAMAFMESNAKRGKPFFAYIPYNTPHSPMQVPDRFWEKFKDFDLLMHNRDPKKEDLQHIRAALAMCENIDWNVGRILKRLDQLEIADNTIVAYFCDNGPNGTRWNGDMKGRKGSTDEGGVRSPMLIRWPAGIRAGRQVLEIGGAIDLLPTLADLAGIPVASVKDLDGKSLKPLLTGDTPTWPDRMIFSHWNKRVSVRTRQHRLDTNGELFDLSTDPGQRDDISEKHPEITSRLRKAVADFRENVLAGYDDDQRPFVVGDPDYRYTQIPARDAKWTGEIKRSNRFPNCSYLSNWTSVSDKIYWEVEVPADGTFEVEMQYACDRADLGATVELSFKDARIRRRISIANEVPERGMENDRSGARAESYVKNWATMKLGRIKLKAGRGELALTAPKIPGRGAADFRLLFLTRVGD